MPDKLSSSAASSVADRVTERFAALPQVEAVALAGSRTGHFPDSDSDVDFYVYVSKDIPLSIRAEIAAGRCRRNSAIRPWSRVMNGWTAPTGTHVDVMDRHKLWIEGQLDRVLLRHEPSVGTQPASGRCSCIQALLDRSGWFAELQKRATLPYPAEAKQKIIAKNLRLLRGDAVVVLAPDRVGGET
jgi:hypothetical protein